MFTLHALAILAAVGITGLLSRNAYKPNTWDWDDVSPPSEGFPGLRWYHVLSVVDTATGRTLVQEEGTKRELAPKAKQYIKQFKNLGMKVKVTIWEHAPMPLGYGYGE